MIRAVCFYPARSCTLPQYTYVRKCHCLDTLCQLHVFLAGSVALAQCFCGCGYHRLIHVTSCVFHIRVLNTLSRRSNFFCKDSGVVGFILLQTV